MSRKTDYVNAQFDDAETKIKELFSTIISKQSESVVGVNYVYENGWFLSVVIYKKGGKTRMVATCVMNSGFGFSTNIRIDPNEGTEGWALPPKEYVSTVTQGSLYRQLKVYAENGQVVINMRNSSTDKWSGGAGPMVIDVTW